MTTASFSPLQLPARSATVPVPARWHPLLESTYATLPGGAQSFWGVPFELHPLEREQRWVWLGPEADDIVHVPIPGDRADYVLFAHFCSPSRSSQDPQAPDHKPLGVPVPLGERLASYVLVYETGAEHEQPIRRRFEVNDVLVTWGQLAFAARPHRSLRPLEWRGPHAAGEWGLNQTSCALERWDGVNWDPTRPLIGTYWVYALPNPNPQWPLAGLRLEAGGAEHIAVAGITLFRGDGDPLRHERLLTLRIDLEPHDQTEVPVTVDLGLVARRYPVRSDDTGSWLASSAPGLGSPAGGEQPGGVIVEVVASEAATLSIAGEEYTLGELVAHGGGGGSTRRPRVEVVDRPRAWVSGEVVDASTGRPTPCRVHFRTLDGRYLPPYGHRREVNDGWFEDYGADLKLGETSYAYIDGRFDIELPVGDVLVEAVKGFEYRPVRRLVRIEPGQRGLTLELEPVAHLRQAGWISVDTHVHFLSPETAWLEAQAEGINLVNILAAHLGDLFTNVADYTGAMSGVSRGDTLVWVGTENRQHILGHLSLLGMKGPMARPLSAGGPNESYLGDPVWTSLAQWADECRAREGLVVVPHFPDPECEVAADIILGKVDGIELRDFWNGVDSYGVRTWYRYLNSGFRVAAVGGTDKMSASMPLGGVRTYAKIGDQDLTFQAWAEAVRAGRTVTTSGPLLEFEVEGHGAGSRIDLPRGGGTVEIRSRAFCVQGLRSIEIVQNGQVIAREEVPREEQVLTVSARVNVGTPGWLAARCQGSAVAWHVWPIRLAAHTSPVFVTVGESAAPVGAEMDRLHISRLVDGGLEWLDRLATRAEPERHSQVRSVFLEARRRLESR